MMKKIEVKLVKGVPNLDEISSIDDLIKDREERHRRIIRKAAIAQNKWLCQLMIMHEDYNINHYRPKPHTETDSATGRIDMWFDYEYVPIKPYGQLSKQEKHMVDKTEHLMSAMAFYDDYDMEHYHIEDHTEDGKMYDCRIYHSITTGANSESTMPHRCRFNHR